MKIRIWSRGQDFRYRREIIAYSYPFLLLEVIVLILQYDPLSPYGQEQTKFHNLHEQA